jgi:hypothetical protein
MIPNLHGGVLNACKWERIHNYLNLEVVVLKVQPNFLEIAGIIKVEKQHGPIGVRNFSTKLRIDIM